MSNLGPLVLSILRDEAMERLIEENRKLRNILRFVHVQFVGPCDDIEDIDFKDHEGQRIFFQGRIDLLDGPRKALLNKPPYFYPMNYADVLQSKVRVGECFESGALGAKTTCLFVLGFTCNRQHQGSFSFRLEFGNSEEEKISLYGSIGAYGNKFSVEDYSELSGMPVEEITSKCDFESNDREFCIIPEDELKPVPVDAGVLESMYGGGFHLEVIGVEIPLQYIKRTCHFC